MDALLEHAGVPDSKFRAICSAIDKLDKEPWEAVRREMTVQKGLSEESADIIGERILLCRACLYCSWWLTVCGLLCCAAKYVTGDNGKSGAGNGLKLLERMRDEDWFKGHVLADKALEELERLFKFLKAMG